MEVAARGEGRARRTRPNCSKPPAGPAPRLQPVAAKKKAGTPGLLPRARLMGLFPESVVQAPGPGTGQARPEPATVTQGRPCSLSSRPPASSAHEYPGPAAIPPSLGWAAQASPGA